MIDRRAFDALSRQKLTVFSSKALKVLEPKNEIEFNWHIDCVCEHLQAVWAGELQKLIINIPPRFLKTHLASVSFPAWGFGHNPSIKFMLTSFKFDRAKSMTRKTRQVMESAWYRSLFENVELSAEQNEKHHFETTEKGQYYAGAMQSVTGEGADIQICDDPLNPMESVSDVQRLNAIETIRETLFSRFNDPRTGRFVLIMQRLHSEDPTGSFLKDEGWHHLKLPAETKEKTTVDLGENHWAYDECGLLFPNRYTHEVLRDKLQQLGSYAYAGQYLQEPVPLGGGEFKPDYLNYFASRDFDARRSNVYITVDPASGKDPTVTYDQDYTAMVVWALAPDQNYYVIDGLKERLNPTERIQRLFDLHRKWNEKSGRPPKVGYEEYGLASDLHYIEKKQNEESYRFAVEKVPPKGAKKIKKEDRIRRLIPPMERGQVWLPNDLYYTDYKGAPRNFMTDIVDDEMLLFPFAPHDDFLDAMSMIFDLNPIFPKIGHVERTDGLEWHTEPESVLDI